MSHKREIQAKSGIWINTLFYSKPLARKIAYFSKLPEYAQQSIITHPVCDDIKCLKCGSPLSIKKIRYDKRPFTVIFCDKCKPEDHQNVYFMVDRTRTKVIITTEPKAEGEKGVFEVFHVIGGGAKAEARLHKKFNQYRLENGLFIYSEEIKSFVENERVKVLTN